MTERAGLAAHATNIQVRWSDVDLAGIAFYPRFFEWYDLGCETLFASLGLAWPEAFPKYEIVGVPIVESGSRFASPVRYGDVLTIRSAVAWVKDTTFRMEHTISVGERCQFGQSTIVIDGNHRFRDLDRPMLEQGYDFTPIRIEDDATITTKCTIIADVGRRAFIGANAVVTRPVAPYTVAVGVPARAVEYFGPPESAPEGVAEPSPDPSA